MKRESKTTNVPIRPNGIPVYPDELEDEDFIEAVGEDDVVVELLGYTRIRVGSPGTGEGATVSSFWDWQNERQFPKGFYLLIKNMSSAAQAIADERKDNKRPYKNFLYMCGSLGTQLFDDEELRDEVMEYGIKDWLRTQE